MLHHDLTSEETKPLPQRRITPDELERAIAALDARRQEQERRQEEEARYLAETLSLEQAVGTLSLDYTPEEIWAEVRHEREAASDIQTEEAETGPGIGDETETGVEKDSTTPLFQHDALDTESVQNDNLTNVAERAWSETNVYTPVILACVTIIGLLLGFSSCGQSGHVSPVARPYVQSNALHHTFYNSPTSYVDLRTRITTTLGDGFYAKLRQSLGPSPRYHITRVISFPPGQIQPDDILYPERAIPDGYSVYGRSGSSARPTFGDTAIVFRNVDAPDPALMSPIYQASQSGPVLVTTRYEGQEYVRCWVRKADVRTLKNNQPVTLYGTREAADLLPTDLIPLTVSDSYWVRSSLWQGTQATDGLYRTSPRPKIKLDSHAWEDYTTINLPTYQPPAWAKISGVFSDFADVSPKPFARYEELDASSEVENVGQIANHHPFHCGPTIFSELLAATGREKHEALVPEYMNLPKMSLSQVWVDVRPNLHRPYTFVKIEENLYLRGWVETPMTEEQMRGHTITIHTNPADPELGYSPTQIQLRLDRCQIDPQTTSHYDSEQTIPVMDVHLDEHAWEKW